MIAQKPLLIAVEGCDGTGKTSIVSALVQAFLSLGIPATSIKRPAKDALAAFYVQSQTVTPADVLAMMNSDCRAAIDTARALQANGTPVVIFDRHWISAAIYQGGEDWLDELEDQRQLWGEPDLWVICHAKWQDVMQRIAKRDQDNDTHTTLETIAARLAQYEWAASRLKSPCIRLEFCESEGRARAWIYGSAWGLCDANSESDLLRDVARMIADSIGATK